LGNGQQIGEALALEELSGAGAEQLMLQRCSWPAIAPHGDGSLELDEGTTPCD